MEPQTIIDQEIPLLDGGFIETAGSASSGSDTSIQEPEKIADAKTPRRVLAEEALSSSLNTETKTILAEYTFESLGAISIGQYVNGVSGAIKISPDGIVGININGVTTFAIDGTTGDATFAGNISADQITAGTFTAAMNVGSGGVIIDGANQRIIINDGTNDRVLIGKQTGGF
jgi:hypothetical protein